LHDEDQPAALRAPSFGRGFFFIDAEIAVLHDRHMSDMTATDAREHFSDALARAAREPVFITRHGRRVATLVNSDFYERAVEALEDADDIAAAHAALDEEGDSIPW
jgi:prevent-host-death family protein